ncbi:MAG: CCA tRNA nucleotidyltransferase [Paracoccaceae bacterium]
MLGVGGEWLENAATQAIFGLLERAAFQVFAVGGCVRNSVLGMDVVDVDFATDALPDEVTRVAEQAGMRVVPTGIGHGTVTVITKGRGFEVTTFRKDVATDGRHAVVAFSDTVAEDASRRDFTMNALYAHADGSLVDPLHGIADLRARRVRFIGDAESRIREDCLRILRFFRFHAWFGNSARGIDAEGLSACAQLAEGVEGLSRERIGAEMNKLLTAPDPAPAVAAMAHAGVLARVLPGAEPAMLAVLVHLEEALATPPDWIRRLATFGAGDSAKLLRLSRREAKRLELYSKAVGSAQNVPELAYRHGARDARNIALLRNAALGKEMPADLNDQIETAAARVFPVRARDLSDRFKDRALGAELSRLERKWIGSGFTLGKRDLLG